MCGQSSCADTLQNSDKLKEAWLILSNDTQSQLSYLYATGLMLSVSQMILKSKQRNNGFVLGLMKCAMISFSLDMDVQLRYSSSTDFFS